MNFRIEPILRIWPQRAAAPRRKGFYETKAAIEEQQDVMKSHRQRERDVPSSCIKVFSSK